jgi:hypothetical protein
MATTNEIDGYKTYIRSHSKDSLTNTDISPIESYIKKTIRENEKDSTGIIKLINDISIRFTDLHYNPNFTKKDVKEFVAYIKNKDKNVLSLSKYFTFEPGNVFDTLVSESNTMSNQEIIDLIFAFLYKLTYYFKNNEIYGFFIEVDTMKPSLKKVLGNDSLNNYDTYKKQVTDTLSMYFLFRGRMVFNEKRITILDISLITKEITDESLEHIDKTFNVLKNYYNKIKEVKEKLAEVTEENKKITKLLTSTKNDNYFEQVIEYINQTYRTPIEREKFEQKDTIMGNIYTYIYVPEIKKLYRPDTSIENLKTIGFTEMLAYIKTNEYIYDFIYSILKLDTSITSISNKIKSINWESDKSDLKYYIQNAFDCFSSILNHPFGNNVEKIKGLNKYFNEFIQIVIFFKYKSDGYNTLKKKNNQTLLDNLRDIQLDSNIFLYDCEDLFDISKLEQITTDMVNMMKKNNQLNKILDELTKFFDTNHIKVERDIFSLFGEIFSNKSEWYIQDWWNISDLKTLFIRYGKKYDDDLSAEENWKITINTSIESTIKFSCEISNIFTLSYEEIFTKFKAYDEGIGKFEAAFTNPSNVSNAIFVGIYKAHPENWKSYLWWFFNEHIKEKADAAAKEAAEKSEQTGESTAQPNDQALKDCQTRESQCKFKLSECDKKLTNLLAEMKALKDANETKITSLGKQSDDISKKKDANQERVSELLKQTLELESDAKAMRDRYKSRDIKQLREFDIKQLQNDVDKVDREMHENDDERDKQLEEYRINIEALRKEKEYLERQYESIQEEIKKCKKANVVLKREFDYITREKAKLDKEHVMVKNDIAKLQLENIQSNAKIEKLEELSKKYDIERTTLLDDKSKCLQELKVLREQQIKSKDDESRIQKLKEIINEKEETIKEKDREKTDCMKNVQKQEEIIEKNKRAIKNTEDYAAGIKREYDNLQGIIEKYKITIKAQMELNKQEIINKKDAEIEKKDAEIEKKDAEIEKKDAIISEKDKQHGEELDDLKTENATLSKILAQCEQKASESQTGNSLRRQSSQQRIDARPTGVLTNAQPPPLPTTTQPRNLPPGTGRLGIPPNTNNTDMYAMYPLTPPTPRSRSSSDASSYVSSNQPPLIDPQLEQQQKPRVINIMIALLTESIQKSYSIHKRIDITKYLPLFNYTPTSEDLINYLNDNQPKENSIVLLRILALKKKSPITLQYFKYILSMPNTIPNARRTQDGLTLLDIAVSTPDNIQYARLLINDDRFNINNYYHGSERTVSYPIIQAVRNQNTQAVALLLSKDDCKISNIDSNGKSAIDYILEMPEHNHQLQETKNLLFRMMVIYNKKHRNNDHSFSLNNPQIMGRLSWKLQDTLLTNDREKYVELYREYYKGNPRKMDQLPIFERKGRKGGRRQKGTKRRQPVHKWTKRDKTLGKRTKQTKRGRPGRRPKQTKRRGI